ncbi:kinase-like protein, partial [Clavulina sp. PMI_390]
REATIHSQLNHPNILPFWGVYHEDHQSYPLTIFPFVERGSLESLLDGLEPHRLMEPQDLLVGATRGVVYLHLQQPPIIHGDIHPGNILIDNSGSPLLCDFGRSRIRHEVSRLSKHEEGGRARFLAPELSDGRADRFCSTQESDVFSLAMTFLNAWSGKPPFPEVENGHKVILMLGQGKRPLRPTSSVPLDPGSEGDLWGLLAEMWAHTATNRPSSAQILKRLERLFDHCKLFYHFT